jgi:glycosyltransferase involved in cell wall biosynthesis
MRRREPDRTRGDRPLRILSLVPFPPGLDASHGGARVVGELLARTAERHRVAVFNLRHPDEPAMDERLRDRLDTVEEVERPRDDDPRVRRRVRASLLTGRPEWPTQLRVRGARARLRTLGESWRPDVVRLEYAAMVEYAAAAGPAPRVLVLYDLPLEAAENRAAVFGRRLSALEVRAWRRFERRAVRVSDAVVVLTDRDRTRLAAVGATTRVARIPIAVDVDAPPLDPRGTEPQSVAFVANFHHAPNADAVRHLVRDLFPRIRQARPAARLYIVGDGLPRAIAETKDDAIVVTGRVPDVDPYLDRAAVVLAPLRLGGGMRVKVLEALAAGKAIVAYPSALAGLDLEHGMHAILARDESAFVSSVTSLLADPRLRKSLGTAARAWAVEHLRWDAVVDAYDLLYADLLAAPRSAPAEDDHSDVARDPA